MKRKKKIQCVANSTEREKRKQKEQRGGYPARVDVVVETIEVEARKRVVEMVAGEAGPERDRYGIV